MVRVWSSEHEEALLKCASPPLPRSGTASGFPGINKGPQRVRVTYRSVAIFFEFAVTYVPMDIVCVTVKLGGLYPTLGCESMTAGV